jgi:hypothetical protein
MSRRGIGVIDERLMQTEVIQAMHRRRAQREPGPHLSESGRLLVHLHREARTLQRKRRGKAANAGTDDRDIELVHGLTLSESHPPRVTAQ